MEFLKELYDYLKVRKKMWLLPIFIIFFLIGVLVIFAESSVLAPFIYSLF